MRKPKSATTPQAYRAIPRRGVALLLVLIAAMVAFVISSAYLTGQATTITISQNAMNQAQARYVAESGLRIAAAYVQRTSTWRTDRVHGTWASNIAYGPDTFTIVGYDGADANGDGTITQPSEGDGNLSDDNSDLLTLVVTGSVSGATHIVRAVISAGTPVPVPQYHWKFDATTGAIAVDAVGGINGTLTNFTTSDSKWTAGQVGNALTFDENNDYVVLSGLPNLTGNFSITAWIRPNNVNGDQRIFCDDRNNSGGFAFSLGDGGAGMLRLFSRSVNPVIIDSSAVVTAGAWQFVAAVHDASARRRKLYRNGVLVGGDSSAYSGTWGTDSGLASIGGEVDGTSEGVAQWRFGGYMDDVRIYTQALSIEQITAIYLATGGGTTEFTLRWVK